MFQHDNAPYAHSEVKEDKVDINLTLTPLDTLFAPQAFSPNISSWPC